VKCGWTKDIHLQSKFSFKKDQLLPAGLYKTNDLLYTNEVIKKSIASGELNWT